MPGERLIDVGVARESLPRVERPRDDLELSKPPRSVAADESNAGTPEDGRESERESSGVLTAPAPESMTGLTAGLIPCIEGMRGGGELTSGERKAVVERLQSGVLLHEESLGAAPIGNGVKSIDDARSSGTPPCRESVRWGGEHTAGRLRSVLLMMDLAEACRLLGER